MTRTGIVAVATLLITAISLPAPPVSLASVAPSSSSTTQPESPLQIDALIEKLSDADPAVRSAANAKLVLIGDPARPALQRAAQSDDPQLSNSARDVLAALPWFQPGDPPLAIELLRSYGSGSVADRIGIIGRLGEGVGTPTVLLRLLQRELNEDVCWQIVAELSKNSSPEILTAARQFDPATNGSAADFLSGAAWITSVPLATPPVTPLVTPLVDRTRGRELMAKAIQLEIARPSYDGGQLDYAFDELASVALYHDQPEEALRLRREQCLRIGVNRDSFPSPFFGLLAVYAQCGPTAETKDDLSRFDRFLGRPESLGVLSRVYRNTGSQAMAATLEQLTMATALTVESQTVSGDTFDKLGYSDLSSDQLRAILSRNNRMGDNWDVQARLHLAQMATQRDDDAMALAQLQLLLDDRKANDLSIEGITELQNEATVHQLRLAEAAHDQTKIDQAIQALLLNETPDTDSCIELAPLLHAKGRDVEAKRVFGASFDPLKKQVDDGDHDPSILNELAWLCARCDQHLLEAMAWSQEAVEARPASSAFLDTQAEVFFRSGKAADAVRFEKRALQFDRGDLFMCGQLQRFEAAAATQPVTLQSAEPAAETH